MSVLNPPPDRKRPWISANLAVSADGKTGDVRHRPSGWTSRADHDRLLELRTNADALLVGRRTLVADNMTLTCPCRDVQPLRCVVAEHGGIPASHPLFERPGGAIHWLIAGPSQFLTEKPVADVTMHRGNLAAFLTILWIDHGVNHIHCEGGGTLIRMLAEMDAIDELHLTLAGHTLFGGFMAPTVTGLPADWLPKSLDFRISAFDAPSGTGECFVSYRRIAQ
jgi:riboflavin biosynthesis pyrimidine reductase